LTVVTGWNRSNPFRTISPGFKVPITTEGMAGKKIRTIKNCLNRCIFRPVIWIQFRNTISNITNFLSEIHALTEKYQHIDYPVKLPFMASVLVVRGN